MKICSVLQRTSPHCWKLPCSTDNRLSILLYQKQMIFNPFKSNLICRRGRGWIDSHVLCKATNKLLSQPHSCPFLVLKLVPKYIKRLFFVHRFSTLLQLLKVSPKRVVFYRNLTLCTVAALAMLLFRIYPDRTLIVLKSKEHQERSNISFSTEAKQMFWQTKALSKPLT